jgi:hypothetical protein
MSSPAALQHKSYHRQIYLKSRASNVKDAPDPGLSNLPHRGPDSWISSKLRAKSQSVPSWPRQRPHLLPLPYFLHSKLRGCKTRLNSKRQTNDGGAPVAVGCGIKSGSEAFQRPPGSSSCHPGLCACSKTNEGRHSHKSFSAHPITCSQPAATLSPRFSARSMEHRKVPASGISSRTSRHMGKCLAQHKTEHDTPTSEKSELAPLPTLKDFEAAAAERGVTLEVRSLGPLFWIEAKASADGSAGPPGKLLGKADGFVLPWPGGNILHIDTMRMAK